MNDVQMMMLRWGDRAWWVIESVFLRSPNKEFLVCLGDVPQTCPEGGRLFADVLAQVYSRPSVGLVLGQRRRKLTSIEPARVCDADPTLHRN